MVGEGDDGSESRCRITGEELEEFALAHLAKVACGAFADDSFVSGRQRRDFAGLRSAAVV